MKIWPHAFYDCTVLKQIKLKETDPKKIYAPLYISGLYDLTKTSILVPSGSEIAYRNNEFFAELKAIFILIINNKQVEEERGTGRIIASGVHGAFFTSKRPSGMTACSLMDHGEGGILRISKEICS